jgi:hypothetical protein
VPGHCEGVGPHQNERRDVESIAIRIKMMMVHMDRLGPYEGTTWNEQQEQLESNHQENRTTRKEGEADHMPQTHPLGEE